MVAPALANVRRSARVSSSLLPVTMKVKGGDQRARSGQETSRHGTRRQLLHNLPTVAVALATGSQVASSASAATAGASEADILDGRWWVFPLAPYQKKKTVRTEAIPGQVWTFDQILGALYVHVPLRMTIVKLSTGGLLAFCPINPTRECLSLVRDLEAEHGSLKYIVLGSAAIEHKVRSLPHRHPLLLPAYSPRLRAPKFFKTLKSRPPTALARRSPQGLSRANSHRLSCG